MANDLRRARRLVLPQMFDDQHPTLAELFAECRRLREQSEAIARRMVEVNQKIEQIARERQLSMPPDVEQFEIPPLTPGPEVTFPWETGADISEEG